MSGGTRVQTTRTEPWDKQKPYLESGMAAAERLYNPPGGGPSAMMPNYYPGSTVASFDPIQSQAQSDILSWAGSVPVSNLIGGASSAGIEGMGFGRSAMGYGASKAAPLSEAQYAGLTPYSATQYGQLLSGEVDPTTFDPLADAYRTQAMNQLTSEVLPGIRQQITQSQAGGGTRGDIVQANAVAAAQQQISDNLAKAEFQAYQQAQDRSLAAAQMGLGAQQQAMGYGMQGADAATRMVGQYPSLMGAPLSMYGAVGDVGAQRQAQEQARIKADMAKYGYEAEQEMIGLQNYLAAISGEFGGSSSSTGPGGPSPLVSALAGGMSGIGAGPPGMLAGAGMGLLAGIAGRY
jgi:hypothetical protein